MQRHVEIPSIWDTLAHINPFYCQKIFFTKYPFLLRSLEVKKGHTKFYFILPNIKLALTFILVVSLVLVYKRTSRIKITPYEI